jgi:hypothetical protein
MRLQKLLQRRNEALECTDLIQEEEVEVFTNGIGLDLIKKRFKTVVETAERKKTFLESGEWKLSPEFISLPYAWHRPRKGQTHHMADVIHINTIISRELGFGVSVPEAMSRQDCLAIPSCHHHDHQEQICGRMLLHNGQDKGLQCIQWMPMLITMR